MLAAFFALAVMVGLFSPAPTTVGVRPVNLEEGMLYSLIMKDGNSAVMIGDGRTYDVFSVQARIPVSAIPTEERKALYSSTIGEPNRFWVFVPANQELVDSWRSNNPQVGNRLREGVLYSVVMADGNSVVMIGDGGHYDVHVFRGQFGVIPTPDQPAWYTPNLGDPEPFYVFVPASQELVESWRSK